MSEVIINWLKFIFLAPLFIGLFISWGFLLIFAMGVLGRVFLDFMAAYDDRRRKGRID